MVLFLKSVPSSFRFSACESGDESKKRISIVMGQAGHDSADV